MRLDRILQRMALMDPDAVGLRHRVSAIGYRRTSGPPTSYMRAAFANSVSCCRLLLPPLSFGSLG